MEENRSSLRRAAIRFVVGIYIVIGLLVAAAFFIINELENDNIVHDTQLTRGVLTIVFLMCWTFACYRLYRINMRLFDQRSQIFDAQETALYATKEATRLQKQFMANMSHEIRTPLNAIIGFGNMLLRGDLNNRERELASNIQLASKTLINIVNDILDLSKIESGMVTLEKIPFELEGLFHSVQQMFIDKAREKNLLFVLDIDPTLPQQLIGDPTRLTQILVNLISNAIKFTDRGEIAIHIYQHKASTKKQDKITLGITVKDTGIGIPSAQLERIFERFTQSDEQTTRIYGGTGLGLSIAKHFIEAMNGTITVQSEVGKGSVFTVLIPFVQATPNFRSVATTQKQKIETEDTEIIQIPASIHLLVVEDNPVNRRVIELLFDEWQFEYTMAHNGRQAVDLLTKSPNAFDLVLMDIQMPEMDGYEATQKIRDILHLQLPIVAMTAHALAGERDKCMHSGMNDYISKPINEHELRRLIVNFTAPSHPMFAPKIDQTYLQETTLGNAEYQRELAQIFLLQIPKDLDAITVAIAAADNKTAARAVHNMKSTVGYMGFEQNLGQLLNHFEIACKEEASHHILLRHLDTIRSQVEAAQVYIKKTFSVE
jgi:signal transduction histidine kinase/CheY-like chemotaxis protein